MTALFFEFEWSDMQSREWLKILSIPTLSWATPFLPFTGLPNGLLDHLERWDIIYREMINEIGLPQPIAIRKDGEYGELVKCKVKAALYKLANQTDQEVATTLEKWVWCHFFYLEFQLAIRRWEEVLNYTFPSNHPKRQSKQIALPSSLSEIILEVHRLIELNCSYELIKQMQEVAPPPPYEQIPYEKMDKCYESVLLSRAISQGITFKALQLIAEKLNAEERLEVAQWAKLQLRSIHPRLSEEYIDQLYGDTFLQTQLPCHSVLLQS